MTASTEEQSHDQNVVTGYAGTKTDTAPAELPQPIKVITAEQYEAQGAINISDTVKYAAGVLANPYGRDTRVDGFNVRGLDALQFRDGMRDIDRTSVVLGKSVSVRVDIGGRRIIKKKKPEKTKTRTT